ncbi:MAG: hypothetical protein CM1200mP2_08960 [Planctomycetaceae bacterium]|nr:MAG: hypothetical protein CM1200mP2_08960 [Planctomycetaceae bacterium]
MRRWPNWVAAASSSRRTTPGLGGRESVEDVARVISGYSDVRVLRTFSQETIEGFCRVVIVPGHQALSDDRHPCQALTDLLTIRETFGDLAARRLVFVGDGNNVAKSLAIACGRVGLSMTLSAPDGYEFDNEFLELLAVAVPDPDLGVETDPMAAVAEADVIYTDVWASMGQESEKSERESAFAGHQVNARLMAAAPETCRFMHDLPARRGLEVTDEVIDGPQSVVFRRPRTGCTWPRGCCSGCWVSEVNMARHDGRAADQLRAIEVTRGHRVRSGQHLHSRRTDDGAVHGEH